MLATHHSTENSLRWMRRLIVISLIIANLAAVILADAASAVTKQHSTPIQYSSIQAGINDIAARFTSPETRANPPQLSISTR